MIIVMLLEVSVGQSIAGLSVDRSVMIFLKAREVTLPFSYCPYLFRIFRPLFPGSQKTIHVLGPTIYGKWKWLYQNLCINECDVHTEKNTSLSRPKGVLEVWLPAFLEKYDRSTSQPPNQQTRTCGVHRKVTILPTIRVMPFTMDSGGLLGNDFLKLCQQ